MNTESETRLAILDFEHEIERLTEDFTGREWIFTEIDNWLKRENERFFILTGEPGVGKSAIAARLTQVRANKTAAYHFCVAGNIGTITPNTVLRSLAAQFGARSGARSGSRFGARFGPPVSDLAALAAPGSRDRRKQLSRPLSSLASPGQVPLAL